MPNPLTGWLSAVGNYSAFRKSKFHHKCRICLIPVNNATLDKHLRTRHGDKLTPEVYYLKYIYDAGENDEENNNKENPEVNVEEDEDDVTILEGGASTTVKSVFINIGKEASGQGSARTAGVKLWCKTTGEVFFGYCQKAREARQKNRQVSERKKAKERDAQDKEDGIEFLGTSETMKKKDISIGSGKEVKKKRDPYQPMISNVFSLKKEGNGNEFNAKDNKTPRRQNSVTRSSIQSVQATPVPNTPKLQKPLLPAKRVPLFAPLSFDEPKVKAAKTQYMKKQRVQVEKDQQDKEDDPGYRSHIRIQDRAAKQEARSQRRLARAKRNEDANADQAVIKCPKCPGFVAANAGELSDHQILFHYEDAGKENGSTDNGR